MKVIKEVIPYIVIVVVVVLIRTFIITPVRVDGDSMKNTLKNGDILLLYKLSSINRFDIIVLDEEKDNEKIIKRVIGLPGETVAIKKGKIYINDKEIEIYGSQGQHRTAILSLKLAELYVIYDEIGEYPILLLDDIFSELDIDKRNKVIKYLDNDIQTIVTTTDIENIDKNVRNKANVYRIENGKIISREII